MNVIGKILPIDGYRVLLKGSLPVDYAKSLTHLYQPLIGIQPISLYQTLLHDIDLQDSSVQTHHILMNYLNIPLDELYRARLKLEGIGLLKSYKNKDDEHTIYTYELQCPFAPAEFFKDAMLTQLLYHHLGNDKHNVLKNAFVKRKTYNNENNITASFHDVFQTFQPYMDNMNMDEDAHQVESSAEIETIDFSWLEQMLKQRMIPVNKVLTSHNKKMISQMMILYDLASYEIEKSLLWALSDENYLNNNEFKDACHDVFKSKHNKPNIKLIEKNENTIKRTVDYKPTTKEEQLIHELETISPKQLLEDLSSGNQASAQDMKIIREVMTTQGLPSPVMNVLIHYVLLQSNMKLSRAYLEKIASHWSRANLQTAREAMAFAKKEKDRYRKDASPKTTYKKNSSKEIVPDWFKERKNKKQKSSSQQKDSNLEQEKEELETLLRKHSSINKNNHLQG
ncbi:replication initiation and membrane attachment family protein [Virgibacillus byunsanensis]|uniref:Replication initiation and membrane attachment family protein n=1 Tax=Virgibacillus byunsanensis TaxID=570945 RepID=A0ABW3LJ03_9BACI